jgi:hypothetical protein
VIPERPDFEDAGWVTLSVDKTLDTLREWLGSQVSAAVFARGPRTSATARLWFVGRLTEERGPEGNPHSAKPPPGHSFLVDPRGWAPLLTLFPDLKRRDTGNLAGFFIESEHLLAGYLHPEHPEGDQLFIEQAGADLVVRRHEDLSSR